MTRLIRLAPFALIIASPALCWWELGHQAIARVAAAHLTPAARARVAEILNVPDNTESVADAMAKASTWADETKNETNTAAWHYIDLTVQDNPADLGLRCKGDNCAPAEIKRFSDQLAGLAPGGRWTDLDALRFLIHLVGDIQQPLHDISDADLGGNCEQLSTPVGNARNLHALWDGPLPQSLGPNDRGVAHELEGDAQQEDATELRTDQSGSPADWAWEGHQLAIQNVYKRLSIPQESPDFPSSCAAAPVALTQAPVPVDSQYVEEMKPVVRRQLLRGGLRLAAVLNQTLGTPAKRFLNLGDLDRLREVETPQVSPDGKWVAYTVQTVDTDADKAVTHVWMVNWDGTQNVQLTFDPESESSPEWSPDGRYLSFVSSRAGKVKGSQVWVMDRRGGEAHQLTNLKNFNLSEYGWSPDSKKLVLVLEEKLEPDNEENTGSKPKPPKPIVVDRYHFKEDVAGYLGPKHNHLYLFDIETEKLEQLTKDNFDETQAVWSPDGSQIAFISNQDPDPDRSENTDLFVIDAKPGARARRLTTFPGPDLGRPAWSPDSKWIAYMQGIDPKYSAYQLERLAVVSANDGNPRLLTAAFDRPVSHPVFAPDGKSILALTADDRSEYPIEVPFTGGHPSRLVPGEFVASQLSERAGHAALLVSSDHAPPEVFALENGSFRKLTSHNDALLAELKLGEVEDVQFKSPGGTEVHGLITKPVGYVAGTKYPTLLRIHGGPNGQDEHDFRFDDQFFAANGYLVLNVNYRGSSGRGEEFQKAIFADWGHKEVADLLAGVDHLVNIGLADPQRLGIGGWSYGGILTDYSIASDQRFKAAISGAGSANQISMYGIDQYVFQYDNEIGPPWKNMEGWIKVSYPFFHADRIHTPTLFMGGDKDFNVPLVGGEQMYQALQSLRVPTELVIYPGEFHGFKRPSFIRDRYQRYIDWYNKYLAGSSAARATTVASR